MTHVGTRIADIAVTDLGDRPVAVFAHGHDVRKHLGGVILVGEPVVHRHTGVGSELLNPTLRCPAVLDSIEHPAQHSGRVLERLLVADLRPGRTRVVTFCPLSLARDFKRPRRGVGVLLKVWTDSFALRYFLPVPGKLAAL